MAALMRGQTPMWQARSAASLKRHGAFQVRSYRITSGAWSLCTAVGVHRPHRHGRANVARQSRGCGRILIFQVSIQAWTFRTRVDLARRSGRSMGSLPIRPAVRSDRCRRRRCRLSCHRRATERCTSEQPPAPATCPARHLLAPVSGSVVTPGLALATVLEG